MSCLDAYLSDTAVAVLKGHPKVDEAEREREREREDVTCGSPFAGVDDGNLIRDTFSYSFIVTDLFDFGQNVRREVLLKSFVFSCLFHAAVCMLQSSISSKHFMRLIPPSLLYASSCLVFVDQTESVVTEEEMQGH